ncbi:MAG: glycosyltransferase family 4 protein [Armatimonadota bacterium]
MKILLVAQNYLPFVGGVEIHARQISRSFRDLGHEVAIVAANFAPYRGTRRLGVLHESLLAPYVADHEDDGIPVSTLCPRSAWDRMRLAPVALRAVPVINRDFARVQRAAYPFFRAVHWKRALSLCGGVDVVHSLANGFLGWLFREAAHACGKPFVNTPFIHPGQWGDAAADVEHYRLCDAVIGLVETDSRTIASLGVCKSKVHTIGVSPDLPARFDPVGFRQRHGLGDDPIVLYVGRMMRQKGAYALVEAMGAVWESAPATRFVFIGPGSPEEIAIFEGLDPRARYLGKVSAQEKGDALAACTVFCMPSMSEILPTVYLEAWSLGKPVVGGLAHGLPELIEGNGAGLAVEASGAAVASALSRLLLEPKTAKDFGVGGKALVETHYSVQAVTEQLLRCYESVSERRTA